MNYPNGKEIKQRIDTNRERLLSLIMSAGNEGVTNAQIDKQIKGKWSARLSELRQKGFDIITIADNEEKGMFRYVLRGTKDEDRLTPFEQLTKAIEQEPFGAVTAEELKKVLKENGLFISSIGNYRN